MKQFWKAPALALVILCSGCGITAVNIPGIGYIDFDPPPVTPEDKTLMYFAIAEAANQGFVGARASWVNHDSGHSGEYIVSKILRFTPGLGAYSPGSCSGGFCGPRSYRNPYGDGAYSGPYRRGPGTVLFKPSFSMCVRIDDRRSYGYGGYGPGYPAAEVTEIIDAGGRKYETAGLGIYRSPGGHWLRFK